MGIEAVVALAAIGVVMALIVVITVFMEAFDYVIRNNSEMEKRHREIISRLFDIECQIEDK